MTDAQLNALRVIFERTHRCTFGFKRSRRGFYVRPATARDWSRFLAGAEAALTELSTEK